MGCGISLVAPSDSSLSYRNISRTGRKQSEQRQSGQSTACNGIYPITSKNRNQAERIKDKERKDLEKEFETEALNAHNKYRAHHGVQNLKFSKSLTAHAQEWANELARKDMMIHSKCVLQNGDIVGENIYMCWSSNVNKKAPARDAVRSWYDEQSIYNYNNASFSYKTGHFTQVVWRDTKCVGMAWAKSSEGCFYVVANYSPAGNVHGMFEKNVPRPLCSDDNNNDSFDKANTESDNTSDKV